MEKVHKPDGPETKRYIRESLDEEEPFEFKGTSLFALFVFLVESSPNDESSDFAGSSSDLVEFCVP